MKRIPAGWFLAVTLAVVGVGPALLWPGAHASAQTLDQEAQCQTWTSQWRVGVGYLPQIGQTFTAGMYGRLESVGLNLATTSSSGVVNVSIQTAIRDAPSGIEIGQAQIPVANLGYSGHPVWVDASIFKSAYLIPGTQYAIVLSSADATVLWYTCEDVNSGGNFVVNDGGTPWYGWAEDGMFRTYVIPDTLDQSQTVLSCGLWWTDTCYSLGLGVGWGQGAQTFIPGQPGALDRVRLHLLAGGGTGTIEISIQKTVAGYPNGTEIGHGSIPRTATTTVAPGSWVEATIYPVNATPVKMVPGNQYAIVLSACCSVFWWNLYTWPQGYMGGDMVYNNGNGWTGFLPATNWAGTLAGDSAFQTFVARQQIITTTPPPNRTITPCSFGICPAAAGHVTPAHSTARVTSNVQFQERPDGTIHGILNFNDTRTGNFALQGCVTESAACELTATRFECTEQHAITVEGTYTPKGGAAAHYQLTLSGVSDGIGTFTFDSGDYTYTLTRHGIVHVNCPPVATP